ncbi:hypothetical protein [Sulfurisphaera ohwakuensis]|uniref:hypothetical protein n=1 Tax=Sulfurisphaera ohwakuensis TaxID=69656 RepID=UPI0036F3AFF9
MSNITNTTNKNNTTVKYFYIHCKKMHIVRVNAEEIYRTFVKGHTINKIRISKFNEFYGYGRTDLVRKK